MICWAVDSVSSHSKRQFQAHFHCNWRWKSLRLWPGENFRKAVIVCGNGLGTVFAGPFHYRSFTGPLFAAVIVNWFARWWPIEIVVVMKCRQISIVFACRDDRAGNIHNGKSTHSFGFSIEFVAIRGILWKSKSQRNLCGRIGPFRNNSGRVVDQLWIRFRIRWNGIGLLDDQHTITWRIAIMLRRLIDGSMWIASRWANGLSIVNWFESSWPWIRPI